MSHFKAAKRAIRAAFHMHKPADQARAEALLSALADPYDPAHARVKYPAVGLAVFELYDLLIRDKALLPAKYMRAVFETVNAKERLSMALAEQYAAKMPEGIHKHAAQNDYHIARWSLMGKDEDIRVLVERALEGRRCRSSDRTSENLGSVSAADAVSKIAAAPGPFRDAIMRLYPSEGEWLVSQYTFPEIHS